ncbi:recombinase family protein [Ruegeria sp.]|uniref:recombinase family protein n=1 Tax=Ruegeria sp. TaxID=1879320 RepID=UPI003AFF737E
MKFGYARVSTNAQELDLQRAELEATGCETVLEEKGSGARIKRPELQRLLNQLRKGDTVVVTRLDRLARSTSELLRVAEVIGEKDAGLQSLAEPWANTSSPSGRMILTVFAGIAEFERELIRGRTENGRKAALQRGVIFGRPPKLGSEQRDTVRQLLENGKSVKEVARAFKVHPATIYRCLNEKNAL